MLLTTLNANLETDVQDSRVGKTKGLKRHQPSGYVLAATLVMMAVSAPSSYTQVRIVSDDGTLLTGVQVVNVGEHVRARVRVDPPGTSFTNPQWLVTGIHIKDWITKDAEPVLMTVADYLNEIVHFVWKDVTTLRAPNTVRVSVTVGGALASAEVQFHVERQPKAEKFYSDDLLMENHNNWHSIYMFWAASTRRGDLFLAWHRSQLEYFNSWRQYFGYPPVPSWDPATPWMLGAMSTSREHPSTGPPPTAGFSGRHDLVTLDLADQGLETPSEGEYDVVTQSQGRGTNSQFVASGYVLRTETVRQILCEDPDFPCSNPNFARDGVATVPSWWRSSGGTSSDPWFAAGCPARMTPSPAAPLEPTCASQAKRALADYTLREFGESIESGQYAGDFRINYHALGHIAASEDMSNPATSMRDPVFWAWHRHLDELLSLWQARQQELATELIAGLQQYRNPDFFDGWSRLRVYFTHRVIPEFVRPENVLVNGMPANSVTDVSLTGTGYIFDFTGFPVPPDGGVEVVVRREVNNNVRTSIASPRPTPTLIVSTYGYPLSPAVSRLSYTKP